MSLFNSLLELLIYTNIIISVKEQRNVCTWIPNNTTMVCFVLILTKKGQYTLANNFMLCLYQVDLFFFQI